MVIWLNMVFEHQRLAAMNHGSESPARTKVARGSDALSDLRSSSITIDDYLATQVDAALVCVERVLHPSDVALIRSVLKQRLETDPLLVALVERVVLHARASDRHGGGG